MQMTHRRGRRSSVSIALLLALLVLGASCQAGDERSDPAEIEPRSSYASNDPLQRGCALAPELLRRIARGHHPDLAEDVLIVPREPNFVGTFNLTSHSGPWDYLQNIPLVLYGPGHIKSSGAPIEAPARTVDVYPTIGRLLGIDLPARDGRVLEDALEPGASSPPRLVVVVVWDGAGRNTLEQWPGRWPNLARLEREGTSYVNAEVGSSPSVTSAVHSSLGTGAFPRSHLVTGNSIRSASGALVDVFGGNSADQLALTTFADEIDPAFGNAPKVGLLGWKNWHMGMMGHGSDIAGGDADELALLRYSDGVEVGGNPGAYSTPSFPSEVLEVEDEVSRVDRADGEVDERWLGHDISVAEGSHAWDMYSNPAWAEFEQSVLEWMLVDGDYGTDEIPDLFFANFKMTDLAGHQWSIDSPETASVLEAQDRALGELVTFLEDEIGDYVVVLTSDHGHTLSPETTGAWPIIQDRLIDHLDAEFGSPSDASLVEESAAWGFHLDRAVMEQLDVNEDDIATFLNGYTIGDNWNGEALPEGYPGREDEQVLSAAFPSDMLDEVSRCNRKKNN